ncbi:MAG: sigma-70 family RNA polymerase sigma factor [Pseudonocardiales bacterium]|nr:sigma-70 family RNA polymerase sigma factor [Pseudonocardiales bacterium]
MTADALTPSPSTETTIRTNTLAAAVGVAIRSHRAGDRAAMTDLVRIVTPYLYRVAFSCRLSAYAADDVVQSTLESALIHLPSLRDADAGLAWLSVIARREAVRVSREERRMDLIGDRDGFVDSADSADPERIALAHMARDALLCALAKLPERYRALLTLLFFDDQLDYLTIASELAMPVGSIGPTRQRGLKKVRALIEQDREQRTYASCA